MQLNKELYDYLEKVIEISRQKMAKYLNSGNFSENIDEDKINYVRAIRSAIYTVDRPDGIPFEEEDIKEYIVYAFDRVFPGRLGPLEPLLKDNNVTEIMVNAYNDIWVETGGQLKPAEVSFFNDEDVKNTIRRITEADGRTCDDAHPFCDCILQRAPGDVGGGSRVNCMIPPISLDHPVIDIRKFKSELTTMEALKKVGTVDDNVIEFINALVAARFNIIVAGGTGSGKTTMVNAVSNEIPNGERIITIEDNAELQLHAKHVLRWQARPANTEGSGEITIRQLVKNALRQRPDRIVVGEVRGAETLDMLRAMSTGHDGSLTTVHATSSKKTLSQINLLIGYAEDCPTDKDDKKTLISDAVDIVIYLKRFSDGRRRIEEIREVNSYVPGSNVFSTTLLWSFVENAEIVKEDEVTGEVYTEEYTGLTPTGSTMSEEHLNKFETAGIEFKHKWIEPVVSNVNVY